ncbi:DUF4129 domain-containing protein [Gillisia limnaea]|uniref:Secreted protein n=1 Tax=Gillisia limnaea (strain DSM 15749 / LMG 21470 / R-8282) TaxID=865937 RepID=H2BV47_GILLR|nr:DUF4129 domain-containing protein [Gillisia limnaea]EHQ03937.1 secreted protein [Gillisia limnaea DSM 15749]
MKFAPVLFLVLFFCSSFGWTQDSLSGSQKKINYDTSSSLEPLEFEEQQISEYKNDKAFDYLNAAEKDTWWTRLKDWVNMRYHQILDWLFGDYEANSILAFFLNLLPYILIIAIIAFAVWLFIRLNPGNYLLADPEEAQVFLSEEEKIIKSENISDLIEQAIREGDYRLAVRYYYLQLLRQLNAQELIQYEFQKTDTEYLNELKKEDFRPELKKLMRIYDFIWYGSFPISENDFKKTQRFFQDFQTSLKTIQNE